MHFDDQRCSRLPIDAFAILQRDHVRVRLLVRKIDSISDGAQERDALLLELSRELAVHASIEEKVLYAELRDAAATREKVVDALKGHERIHELLFDLAVMAPDEAAWRRTFTQLAATIVQYVEREEAELFPIARKLIAPLRQRRMTRDVIAEQRRLTRVVAPTTLAFSAY